MNITDALEETGKAEPAHRRDASYVEEGTDGILYWFNKKDNKQDWAVPLNMILDFAWTAYHPTPEKCEACKEAAGFFEDCFESKHLRKYHCTCKKEKP